MIEQGHKYKYEGQPVIAMESAERGLVLVRRIDSAVPVIGMQRAIYVAVDKLVAEPMRYHGNKIP